jgi:phosphate transport system substrate-binding protein
MNQNPNAEVAVTGGGSGTGIAALINGTTDICAASREMKDKEKSSRKKKELKLKKS